MSLVLTALAFAYLARVPDEGGYTAVLLPAFLVAGFTFATAFVPLTSQGMTGVREGEKGLALAFAVAAGILAIGAITANRTLPARGRRLVPSARGVCCAA